MPTEDLLSVLRTIAKLAFMRDSALLDIIRADDASKREDPKEEDSEDTSSRSSCQGRESRRGSVKRSSSFISSTSSRGSARRRSGAEPAALPSIPLENDILQLGRALRGWQRFVLNAICSGEVKDEENMKHLLVSLPHSPLYLRLNLSIPFMLRPFLVLASYFPFPFIATYFLPPSSLLILVLLVFLIIFILLLFLLFLVFLQHSLHQWNEARREFPQPTLSDFVLEDGWLGAGGTSEALRKLVSTNEASAVFAALGGREVSANQWTWNSLFVSYTWLQKMVKIVINSLEKEESPRASSRSSSSSSFSSRSSFSTSSYGAALHQRKEQQQQPSKLAADLRSADSDSAANSAEDTEEMEEAEEGSEPAKKMKKSEKKSGPMKEDRKYFKKSAVAVCVWLDFFRYL
eukprot:GHVT01013467.1.p1 GENE.GHVT01013467.1~~GHVT01013467.1.p1  ORF type:complete len:404 (+),score=83.01 GHVT01013467.1:911-2122(+)